MNHGGRLGLGGFWPLSNPAPPPGCHVHLILDFSDNQDLSVSSQAAGPPWWVGTRSCACLPQGAAQGGDEAGSEVGERVLQAQEGPQEWPQRGAA